MSWSGEIAPASMAQIKQGRGGRVHIIEADAGGVAQGLKRLDARLHLRYSEGGGHYVVYCREKWEPEGNGHLVGTYQECDQRIVKDVEQTIHKWRQPGFSFADELEKQDAEAERKADHEWSENFGETAERLAHAIRKDLALDKATITVPDTWQ